MSFRERKKTRTEIDTVLEEIRKDKHVQEMKKYIQHGQVSTYEHCERVAAVSYQVDKKLHLNSDRKTLLKGAMLHDFYLYDWHERGDGSHRLHGFSHAERAEKNAEKYVGADPKVQEVIRTHMWPLNLTRIPRTREAWIVCAADKYVSFCETLVRR